MSFKREGDDYSALNLVKKRRVEELLSKDIPEDEACLLSNGRFTCLVCSSRPILDTVDMLCVHRNGKKHKYSAEHFFRKKREFHRLIEKRRQEASLQGKKLKKNDDSDELDPAPLIEATRTAAQNTLLRYAPYNPVSSGAQSSKNTLEDFKTNRSKNKGFFEYTRNVLTHNAPREKRNGLLIDPPNDNAPRTNAEDDEASTEQSRPVRKNTGKETRISKPNLAPSVKQTGANQFTPTAQLPQRRADVVLRPYVSKRRRKPVAGSTSRGDNSCQTLGGVGSTPGCPILGKYSGTELSIPNNQDVMTYRGANIGHHRSLSGVGSSESVSDDSDDWEPLTEYPISKRDSNETRTDLEGIPDMGHPKDLKKTDEGMEHCEIDDWTASVVSETLGNQCPVEPGLRLRQGGEKDGRHRNMGRDNPTETRTRDDTIMSQCNEQRNWHAHPRYGCSDQSAECRLHSVAENPSDVKFPEGRTYMERQEVESSEEMFDPNIPAVTTLRGQSPHEVANTENVAAKGRDVKVANRCQEEPELSGQSNYQGIGSQFKPCSKEYVRSSESQGELPQMTVSSNTGKKALPVKFSMKDQRIGMNTKESRHFPGDVPLKAVENDVSNDSKSEGNVSVADVIQKNVLKKSRAIYQESLKVDPLKYSEERKMELEKHLELTSSGWVHDPSGKWVKDENAEFDSDEEEPN